MIRRFSSAGTWSLSLSRMLVLSETDVKQCLDMTACLAVNRRALRVIATGDAIVPTRLGIRYGDTDDWSLFKPAALPSTSHLGIKVVSVRGDNPSKYDLPQVPATILHMNYTTGVVEAVVAGTYLTAARTAAGSALAIQYGCPILRHLVIFGAGLQAQLHLEAVQTAMMMTKTSPSTLARIPRLTIVNRSAASARALLDANRDRYEVADVVLLSDDDNAAVLDALASADAVCACTSAQVPLWNEARLPDRCVITAVGSYSPDRREIAPATIAQCDRIYVDTYEAQAAGDLKDVDDETKRKIALLGDILADDFNLTTSSSSGRVFYKSVGTAIQDVLTTAMVVDEAKRRGIGHTIDMS
jgi:ornithine cyclodeaminase